MRPLPRSTMCASAAWDMKNAPDRFTASTVYQSSSVIFCDGFVHGDAGVVDQDVEPSMLFDDLADGASTVLGGRDIAVVHARPDTEQILVAIGECLGALDVVTVTCGHRCVLVPEALQIAAPMPRVPSVTKATRPRSFSPPPRHGTSCCSVSKLVMTHITSS